MLHLRFKLTSVELAPFLWDLNSRPLYQLSCRDRGTTNNLGKPHLDSLSTELLAVDDLDFLRSRKAWILLDGDLLGLLGPLARRLFGLGLPLGLFLGLADLLLPELGHLLQLGLGHRLVKLAYKQTKVK